MYLSDAAARSSKSYLYAFHQISFKDNGHTLETYLLRNNHENQKKNSRDLAYMGSPASTILKDNVRIPDNRYIRYQELQRIRLDFHYEHLSVINASLIVD